MIFYDLGNRYLSIFLNDDYDAMGTATFTQKARRYQ